MSFQVHFESNSWDKTAGKTRGRLKKGVIPTIFLQSANKENIQENMCVPFNSFTKKNKTTPNILQKTPVRKKVECNFTKNNNANHLQSTENWSVQECTECMDHSICSKEEVIFFK